MTMGAFQQQRDSFHSQTFMPELATGKSAADSISDSLRRLQDWIESRDYAGYEPFDILNSPCLRAALFHRFPVNWLLLQAGKRWGGLGLRRFLRIPPSKNPKALALVLAAYCDLLRCGQDCLARALYLAEELDSLRSPQEDFFGWGYDWDYVSLRTTVLPAFRPNAVASIFAGSALLDLGLAARDQQAIDKAASTGEFIVRRLNRPVDNSRHVSFSYTPADQTRVYNVTALAGAFLARLGDVLGERRYLNIARRAMQYVVDGQLSNGGWFYGAGKRQRWIDGFHTGYNLCALLEYHAITQEPQVKPAIESARNFYRNSLLTADGVPKYYAGSAYPIDVHCCAQAILTFCALRNHDSEALQLARRTAQWTINHMRASDGSFFYRRHHFWTDETPYMRWGQAWMFRALARLRCETQQYLSPTQARLDTVARQPQPALSVSRSGD